MLANGKMAATIPQNSLLNISKALCWDNLVNAGSKIIFMVDLEVKKL